MTFAIVGAAAALMVALLFIFGPNKNAAPEVLSNLPAELPAPQVKAPISDEARRVAVRFIQTAVARKSLPEAWTLVGPNLRGGLTREEWITGNNPVVPYPIAELAVAPFKVDESFTDSALIEVALLPRKGSDVKPQLFYLALERTGSGPKARWVVNNWVPRSSVVLPK